MFSISSHQTGLGPCLSCSSLYHQCLHSLGAQKNNQQMNEAAKMAAHIPTSTMPVYTCTHTCMHECTPAHACTLGHVQACICTHTHVQAFPQFCRTRHPVFILIGNNKSRTPTLSYQSVLRFPEASLSRGHISL